MDKVIEIIIGRARPASLDTLRQGLADLGQAFAVAHDGMYDDYIPDTTPNWN